MTESVVVIDIGEHALRVVAAGAEWTLPVGIRHVAAQLVADPPLPEELTNAVGLVADHIEDVMLERPDVAYAGEHLVSGVLSRDLADTEAGLATSGPTPIARADAEELFRTLATESLAERSRNPGLSADAAPAILAASCLLVGVMRRLNLEVVTIT
jgi:exopolyphosphatase / guanosine-5'-triphosphate,3'-diphosphate pyrophosphatase